MRSLQVICGRLKEFCILPCTVLCNAYSAILHKNVKYRNSASVLYSTLVASCHMVTATLLSTLMSSLICVACLLMKGPTLLHDTSIVSHPEVIQPPALIYQTT